MNVIDEAVVEEVRRRLDQVETIENVRILLLLLLSETFAKA